MGKSTKKVMILAKYICIYLSFRDKIESKEVKNHSRKNITEKIV